MPGTHSATFLVAPVAKGRPRVTSRGTYNPSPTREATKTLQILMRAKRPAKIFTGPLALFIRFQLEKPKSSKNKFPIVRPDIDNFTKLVMDAGNEIWWKDDAQIVDLQALKCYAKHGCIMVEVQQIEFDGAW